MTLLAIEQVGGDELRGNAWLSTELLLLAAPSYDDATAILAREVAGCTHLYLSRDACGQLAGFLITRREASADDESLPLVHVGWSVCRADLKNSGATMALFERCIIDIRAWERALGRRALLWSTTASPTIYRGVSRYLAEVEPDCDGRYSRQGGLLARLVRRHLGMPPIKDNEHPFVAHGIAVATRYSSTERQRIAGIARRRQFGLFARLGIDEGNGDRLIFIARTPPDIGTTLSRASVLALMRRSRLAARMTA